ncbi:MAG: hypothetical protein LBQ83_01230 [Candidatus Margulisbacteria bacterium]|jgi:hypothetical protein|nr:hypothetical protein [Candidatus Margulisiibacteriota bacterium]
MRKWPVILILIFSSLLLFIYGCGTVSNAIDEAPAAQEDPLAPLTAPVPAEKLFVLENGHGRYLESAYYSCPAEATVLIYTDETGALLKHGQTTVKSKAAGEFFVYNDLPRDANFIYVYLREPGKRTSPATSIENRVLSL